MKEQTNPIVLENLRKIWELKKSEMQINQQDAARDLGWTQGAFSQYLNSITKLNTAAVIKIANYLGVPASSIDPDISSKLPAIHHIKVRYQNKSTTPLKNKGALVHTVSGSTSSMIIEITEKFSVPGTKMYAWPGQKLYIDHTAVVQKRMRTIPSRVPAFVTIWTKSAKDREFTYQGVASEDYMRLNPNDYNKHFTVVGVYMI